MATNLERTGRDAVSQNVQGLVQFLQQHAPFDLMEEAHLVQLLEASRLTFYPKGAVLLKPDGQKIKEWFLIRQGSVKGVRMDPGEGRSAELMLEAGDAFPAAAILGDRPTRTTYTAAEDTFCLQMPVADYGRLLELSEPFRQFSLKGISSLLGKLQRQVQQNATVSLGAQYSLDMPLSDLLGRAPQTCPPHYTVQQAVQEMHQRRVGSVAVVDEAGALKGIFTLRDLRDMVANGQQPAELRMADCMVPNPYHLPPQATAFEAALLMTQHHITHVCVVENGKLVGVLSERDLFALQRLDLVHLARAIRQADSVESLVAQRKEIHRLVDGMLMHGASSAQILSVITQLNDHTTVRVIELMLAQHGDPGIPFTWIAFGSEGREEQTLLTDQDNGILFEADTPEQAEAARQKLLPLASAINHALDQCGLTLCKGNIMASNPKLCLSAKEWYAFYTALMLDTNPENLLNATIFFDIRVLWGPDATLKAMQQDLWARIAQDDVFQRMMAHTAQAHVPPAEGLRNRLGQALGWKSKEEIDLKTQALTPFVDFARILSLANGITAASTQERFAQLAAKEALPPKRVEDWLKAYSYLQLLRLQHHRRQSQAGEPVSNTLELASLNTLDQRILRESLREARSVHETLRLRYQLS